MLLSLGSLPLSLLEIDMIPIGTKVYVDKDYESESVGVIIGTAIANNIGLQNPSLYYVVELEEAGYLHRGDKQKIYVRMLLAHPDNVEVF